MISYKGYSIRIDYLDRVTIIAADGKVIGSPSTIQQAKDQIDQLVD